MDATSHAAWFQAIASVIAIGIAIFIPWWQRHIEAKDRLSDHRRRVMSAAAVLDNELAYESAVLDFAPLGNNEIGYDFNLAEAAKFMKLRPEAWTAIRGAVENAHFFSDELCEQIVRLGVEAAAYDRIIDDAESRDPFRDVNEFFQSCSTHTARLQDRMNRVRSLLQNYLPKGD